MDKNQQIDYIHTFLLADQMKHTIIPDTDISIIYKLYKSEGFIENPLNKKSDTYSLFSGYYHQLKDLKTPMLFNYSRLVDKQNTTAIMNLIDYYKTKENIIESKKYETMLKKIQEEKRQEEHEISSTIEEYLSKGETEKAIDYCRNQIEIGHQFCVLSLAEIYYTNEKYSMMIETLMDAIEDEQHVPSLIRLSKYYIQCNNLKSIHSLLEYYVTAISYEYSKEIISLKNEYIFFILGKYYSEHQNLQKMKQFYEMAIDLCSDDAMIEYAKYNLGIGNIKLFKKYIEMAIENHNCNAMNELGMYYFNQSMIPIKEEYYKEDYIYFYTSRMTDFDMGFSYLMNAYTKGYSNEHILGDVFRLKQDYENMENYYHKAITEHQNEYAMIRMADYYNEVKKDEKNTIKYLLMALNKNNLTALRKIKDIYINKEEIDKYIDLVKNKILENDTFFKTNYPKFTLFLESRKKYFEKGSCSICYETTTLIPFDCFCHMFCVSCYCRIDSCALCKLEKHPANKGFIEHNRRQRYPSNRIAERTL
jgi:tetratricopeptide (TPR) repeat protein